MRPKLHSTKNHAIVFLLFVALGHELRQTAYLEELAALRAARCPLPLGVGVVRVASDYYWTLTGPAHPSGGPHGPCWAEGKGTNAKFIRDSG